MLWLPLYPLGVAVLFAVSSELMGAMLMSEYVWLFGTAIMSMVIVIILMGAFIPVVEQVTGKFTSMIQATQGAVGMGAGLLGAKSGPHPGRPALVRTGHRDGCI